jgi:hypothetical protein
VSHHVSPTLPSSGQPPEYRRLPLKANVRAHQMRTAYVALSAVMLVASALLGLFFLGSAGLAAPEPAMRMAWVAWALLVLAAVAGVALAVRRLSIAGLVVSCLLPFLSALGLANLALRFAH